jgi:hypothetical protein
MSPQLIGISVITFPPQIRALKRPGLDRRVRAKVIEYVQEKASAGAAPLVALGDRRFVYSRNSPRTPRKVAEKAALPISEMA